MASRLTRWLAIPLENSMKIKYVGLKTDGETAFIHLTNLTWFPGDSHEVDNKHAPRLLAHPDVFEQDIDAVTATTSTKTVATTAAGSVDSTKLTLTPGAKVEDPKPVSITLPDGTDKVVEGLTKEELHALAKELDLQVHFATGPVKLIAALVEAFPVKG
jgi:hypothetical protein